MRQNIDVESNGLRLEYLIKNLREEQHVEVPLLPLKVDKALLDYILQAFLVHPLQALLWSTPLIHISRPVPICLQTDASQTLAYHISEQLILKRIFLPHCRQHHSIPQQSFSPSFRNSLVSMYVPK